jgi:hypothetical protein
MKVTVGTTAMKLPVNGSATPVLQNLGPGVLYLDNSPAVDTSTGFQLPAGAVYEFPRDLGAGGGAIYVVASAANTDLRVLVVG